MRIILYIHWKLRYYPSNTPMIFLATNVTKKLDHNKKYLRVFLDDPQIPLDNNLAEQSIRPFCVGKKNWKLIDTVHGAQASAIIYSIVETAKANDLNIYNYFKHLLTEVPKHMDDTDLSFLDPLLPWSKQLPAECRKKKKTKSG